MSGQAKETFWLFLAIINWILMVGIKNLFHSVKMQREAGF